jgi:hypothetical protein
MRLRLLLGLAVIACAGFAATQAGADPNSVPICSSAGTALAGSYNQLVVTGNAYVAAGASLNVRGNLILAPGSCLDAFSLGTVTVGGNVLVGHGATLGLGCTPESLGDPTIPPCFDNTTNDVGWGSSIADQPLTMYLDGDTIHGNLISLGGGPGLYGEFLNFPIKDNTIGGSLLVSGWQGGWFGVIRDHIAGSALINGMMSIQDSDSNEIQTNTIGGSLICFRNSPAAQVNPDDGGQPNVVGGLELGQCAGL